MVERLLDDGRSAVADALCGDGRLTVPARRERVGTAIGIDLAAGRDRAGTGRAAARRAFPRRRPGRRCPTSASVDAVISWGNSFGYLHAVEDTAALAGGHAGGRARRRPARARVRLRSPSRPAAGLSGGGSWSGRPAASADDRRPR